MNDIRALTLAIASQPDEDTPRLVAADWYDENGQPERAEFIRDQVQLARETISPTTMKAVSRVMTARAKNKAINFKPGRVAEMVVRQHLHLLNYGQAWRFAACPKCGGRGTAILINPHKGQSYTVPTLDELPYSDGSYTSGMITCPDCVSGDAGCLCHYRKRSHDAREPDSLNWPYRGTFVRGFVENVGLNMWEVAAVDERTCPQCGGEKADSHSRCLKCFQTGLVRYATISPIAARMMFNFPTIRRMYVVDAIPLHFTGAIRPVYSWVGGTFGPRTTSHIPDPFFREIDWSKAESSSGSHGYSGWETLTEANDVLARAVVKAIRRVVFPKPRVQW